MTSRSENRAIVDSSVRFYREACYEATRAFQRPVHIQSPSLCVMFWEANNLCLQGRSRQPGMMSVSQRTSPWLGSTSQRALPAAAVMDNVRAAARIRFQELRASAPQIGGPGQHVSMRSASSNDWPAAGANWTKQRSPLWSPTGTRRAGINPSQLLEISHLMNTFSIEFANYLNT